MPRDVTWWVVLGSLLQQIVVLVPLSGRVDVAASALTTRMIHASLATPTTTAASSRSRSSSSSMTTSGMMNPSTGLPMAQSPSLSPLPFTTTATTTTTTTPAVESMLTPTTTTTTDLFDQIASELEQLAVTYGMRDRQHSSRARNKLQPRHCVEFSHPTTKLFDQMARVVCHVMVIPRKELFETWAMALYVHRTFLSSSSSSADVDDHPKEEEEAENMSPPPPPPIITRIADVACSHGLLSWALLLLSHYDETTGEPLRRGGGSDAGGTAAVDDDNDHGTSSSAATTTTTTFVQRLSVVCIDVHMPKSAEKLAAEMLKEWPDLHTAWDYVQGPLEALIPSSSTLLVGIHACGILSDKMISHTIQGGCCLALVPCCHSKKSLSAEQKQSLLPNGTDKNKNNDNDSDAYNNTPPMASIKSYSLADLIDHYRIQRLHDAGFEVQEATIPPEFTPKNRIILARPKNAQARLGTEHEGPQSMRSKDLPNFLDPSTAGTTSRGSTSDTAHPSKQSKSKEIPEWAKPSFTIPLADTPHDRAIVRALAGREAANRRDPRQQPLPARSAHVSLFVPPDNIHMSAKELEPTMTFLELGKGGHVEALCPAPYLHPTAGRYVRTFKVTFPLEASKMQCRDYFSAMRQRIPELIPGASVRY